jgi:hypothetical protein
MASVWSHLLKHLSPPTRRNLRRAARPRLTCLESRETPAFFGGGVEVAAGVVNGVRSLVAGAGPGATPTVQVRNAATGRVTQTIQAFDAGFRGGVSVAVGDFNGSDAGQIVVGAGAGGVPLVNVYNPNGTLLRSFLAFDAGFRGGVHVASGDVNGDGRDDIIVGAGVGGTPHIKVFSGSDNSVLRNFFAFDAGYRGGVTVAASDLNGDGRAEIVAGAAFGGAPQVIVFNGVSNAPTASFLAFDASYLGGVRVAAAGGRIFVGAGIGGVPLVHTFSASGRLLRDTIAFDTAFKGGVWVAAAPLNGDGTADLIVGAGAGGSSDVKAFDGANGRLLVDYQPFGDRAGSGIVGAGTTTPTPTPTTDTIRPTVAITSPAQNQTFTNTNPTIVGTATDNVGVTRLQANIDNGGFTNIAFTFATGAFTFTPTSVTAAGPHSVTFRATDAAGNVRDVVFAYTRVVDTTAPTVTITSPPSGQTVDTNRTISGTVADNIGVTLLEARTDSGAFASIPFTAATGAFSFTTTLPLDNTANGNHTVEFRARDAAGNTSTVASFTFTLAADTTAPTATITSPADNQTFSTNPTVAGTATDSVGVTSVEVSVDNAAFATTGVTFNATTGAFSFTTALPLDNSAVGNHTVRVQAKDGAGNVSTIQTLTFTLAADNTNPPASRRTPADSG